MTTTGKQNVKNEGEMSGEEYFHEKFLDPRKQRKIKFICPRHTVDVDRIYALRSSMIYMDLYMCRFHLLLTGFCQSSPILIFHEYLAGVVQVLLHVFFHIAALAERG